MTRSLLSFGNKLAAACMHRKTVPFHLPRPVVSFCFDDFPATALHQGGAILEAHQLRGTYYLSAGSRGEDSSSGPLAGDADIAACIARGHELGCHSYDHMDCQRHSAAQIAGSMAENRAMIRSHFGYELQHFAYPFGSVGPAAKKAALAHYASARTTRPGINAGTIDLGMLKACGLYSRKGTQGWQPYLEALCRQKGWLIFYTHDVSESPSEWGCTLQELQTVVVQALAMNYDILPVGETVRRLKKET